MNVVKSSIALIRCSDVDLPSFLADFPAAIAHIPSKYLRLPLSLGRLCKVDLQPYIDMTTLVKSVLTALSFSSSLSSKVDIGTLKAIDKL
jgi:hypothetical protein